MAAVRPKSIRTVEVISFAKTGPLGFPALAEHASSLVNLRLNDLDETAMTALTALSSCTGLEMIYLGGRAVTDFHVKHPDSFQQIARWVQSCKRAVHVTLRHIPCAMEILGPLLRDNTVKLHTLHLYDCQEMEVQYTSAIESFYEALAYQTELVVLHLTPYWEGEDDEGAVVAISKMEKLEDLSLSGAAFGMDDELLSDMLCRTKHVGALQITARSLTDAILPAFSRLRKLRVLTITADADFTTEGLIEYIQSMGPGNHHMIFSIASDTTNEDVEKNIPLIETHLATMVKGKFEFLSPSSRSISSCLNMTFDAGCVS